MGLKAAESLFKAQSPKNEKHFGIHDFEPVEQKSFEMVLRADKKEIYMTGTQYGYELTVVLPKYRYILYAQRGAPRRFKSPKSAFNYLSRYGVYTCHVQGIDCSLVE